MLFCEETGTPDIVFAPIDQLQQDSLYRLLSPATGLMERLAVESSVS